MLLWLAGGHGIPCMVRQPTETIFDQMISLQHAPFLLGFSLFDFVCSRAGSLSQTASLDVKVPVIGEEYWGLTYHPGNSCSSYEKLSWE